MNYDNSTFSEEELAYLNSGGAEPPPASEAKPEPAAEPQAETDETPEAAAPEPAAETTDPDVEVSEHDEETGEDGKPKKRRKVDYGAYLRQKNEAEAARKEREELREKYNALERERAAVNERIRIAQEMSQRQQAEAQQRAAQANQPQQAAPPDRNEDPLGYMAWQDERLARLEQGFQQTAQERQQQAALRQLDDAYRSDNHQALKEVPGYADAYNHFIGVTERVLSRENPNWTLPQVKAEAERQERLLAVQAHQTRQRPAQLIWERALAYGFRPAAPQAAQAPVQPDPAAEQARIDAAARGQAQNVSLSNTGRPSGAVSGTMTLDKLTRMSDDDRYRYLQANPDAIQRIMGEA